MPDSSSKDEISRELPDATPTRPGTNLAAIHQAAAAPALAIWFDEALFNKAKLIATYIAGAEGFTPKHLIGKPQACFAVVERSLTWRLSPFAVAASTFQIPGSDRVGYEGKLVQAILENSGQIEGAVRFEHYGSVAVKFKNGRMRMIHTNDPELEKALAPDSGNVATVEYGWENVQGKWEIKKNSRGNEYASATWTNEDAKGLGVTVIAQVRGEAEPRRMDFDLVQAFPRNSTLWATDPMTQIKYVSVRRFASVAAPGIFMGVPFDQGDVIDPGMAAVDVTPPRPERPFDPTFPDTGQPKPKTAEQERDAQPYEIVGGDGEIHHEADLGKALDLFRQLREQAIKRAGDQGLEGLWESNGLFLSQLRERDYEGQADQLGKEYGEVLAEITRARQAETAAKEAAKAAAPAQDAPGAQEAVQEEQFTEGTKDAGAGQDAPAPSIPEPAAPRYHRDIPEYAAKLIVWAGTAPAADVQRHAAAHQKQIDFIRENRAADWAALSAVLGKKGT